MIQLLTGLALVALVLMGGILGFFYAWVCSTMWGLDAASPDIAIAAMQAMNASVRNAVFAPAFFGTPVILVLTALVAGRAGRRVSAWSFGAAALIYFGGAFLVTMLVNVPMNEALGSVTFPIQDGTAHSVWQKYSAPWQFWNQLRTGFSAVALMLVGVGLMAISRPSKPLVA